ncbi:winged helix-turn-helix domain-containing protein [Citrobacter freundii]|uniref:winged helix-turn-helix domain-containing protein n=1 Tax=Citrobacter freundii TaxID=546 RepID=UPI0013D01BBD|nr:winged helix-turn-helix domain-containing protein [Citrobacter freundii]EKU3699870.1 winged helix-turn-helix domain-containing protein [Citrobacter freundii]MBJ8836759.1 winged helix-turn-helix domain-containing protein [Citrobacter freundii]MBJ8913459.1 winged helix-turn-helix domain-containing protein [Citrobacter freundii]NZA23667.1 winged helix-turn-helix domain-containing protein [Citrobacter freundii]HCJ7426295.1 winged helix-turn-helix domain-containing protein [Citrobacter freundii]
MKYLINNEVTFRTDDGVLANLSSSDNSLTLSITANRIFTYLLEQEGKVVSREEMFTNVWDKNGLQASNNSLSQYISLIRKGLKELGCEHEIIQTVPRVGFFIAEGLVATIEEPPSVTVTSLAPSKAAPSLSKRVKMTLLAAGGISLLMLLYPVNSLFNSSKNNLPDVQLFKLGNIDLCPVYTVFESSPEIATAKLEKAQKMADLHLKCLAGALFIFQPDDLYVYGEKGRVFLSRCTFNNAEKTKFAGCKDLYIHEY